MYPYGKSSAVQHFSFYRISASVLFLLRERIASYQTLSNLAFSTVDLSIDNPPQRRYIRCIHADAVFTLASSNFSLLNLSVPISRSLPVEELGLADNSAI